MKSGDDESRIAARIADAYRATPVDDVTREASLAALQRALAAPPKRTLADAWRLPAWGLAAAAALALAFLAGVQVGGRHAASAPGALASGASAPGAVGSAPAYDLEFTCAAPEARRVALVGDFDDWDANALPMRRERDGLWSARVRLPAGWHRYAFVIDGTQWRTDPSAPMAAPGAFGAPSSVVHAGSASL